MDAYLSAVGTSQAELNDEHRFRGDHGVRRGVGRRGDDWICAALSYHQPKGRKFTKSERRVSKPD